LTNSVATSPTITKEGAQSETANSTQ
jgi:hypothetical protein